LLQLCCGFYNPFFTVDPILGFDAFGDILQPASQTPATTTGSQKLIQGDLDSSLASLAGNLSINPSQQVKK